MPAKPNPPSPEIVARQAHANRKTRPVQAVHDQYRAFARLLFAGEHSVVEAWRQVFEAGKGKKATTKVAEACAYKIKRHKVTQEELARLKALHAEQLAKEEAQRQQTLREAEAAAIATRDEVLKFHTKVMRCPSNVMSEQNADLVLVVETKRLAPPKYDKEGNEIPNLDADADGYITDVTRRPPDVKERQKSAEALAAMQGWNKSDPNMKKAADSLTDLLLAIRGGGKA